MLLSSRKPGDKEGSVIPSASKRLPRTYRGIKAGLVDTSTDNWAKYNLIQQRTAGLPKMIFVSHFRKASGHHATVSELLFSLRTSLPLFVWRFRKFGPLIFWSTTKADSASRTFTTTYASSLAMITSLWWHFLQKGKSRARRDRGNGDEKYEMGWRL